MMNYICLICALFSSAYALAAGTMKENALLPLSIMYDGKSLSTSVVIDANWRWLRFKDNYDNCFSESGWEPKYCPDPITCSRNCVIEGAGSVADYGSTYGVTTSGNSLTLRYITKHQYGTNVGSRMYLLAPDGKNYQGFNLLNREFVFTADMSKTECGTNAAVYFVEMPLDGNVKLNGAGAPYALSYGDAQMPKDIRYIDNWANMNGSGPASNEYDVWEANKYAASYTAHTCKYPGVKACVNDKDCGISDRFGGWCDKNGADINLFREDPIANKYYYGPGMEYKIDTTRPFQIITQFITNDGTDAGYLVEIKRFYKQDGKIVVGGSQTTETIAAQKKRFDEPNHFEELGGLKAMGESFRRKMVISLSFWDDEQTSEAPDGAGGFIGSMAWLDARMTPNREKPGEKPGDLRGPCPNGARFADLRVKYPLAKVVYSDIQVNKISNLSPTPTPTQPTPTQPTPTQPTPFPTPSPTQNMQWKCQKCVFVKA